jgi:hypothetical protein
MVLGYNPATGTCTGITRIAGTAYDGTYQTQFVVPNSWASSPGEYSIKVEYPPPEQQWSWNANWNLASTTTTTTTTTTQPPPAVTIETLDSASGNLWWPSIAIAPNGNPGISYRHPDGAKFAACNNPTCTSATLAVFDDSAGANGGTSLVYGNQGYPIVAYYHHPDTGLKVATCTSACTHPQVTYWIDMGYQVNTGNYPSIALKSNGVPFIGFYHGGGGDARIANCLQQDCSWSSIINNNGIVTLDNAGPAVIGTAGTVSGPFLVYWQSSYNRLRAAQCENTSCSAWNFSDLDSGITNNPYPSVAINNNGMPVIAYYDVGNGDLKVVACLVQNCWPGNIGVSGGTGQPISIVDSVENVGTNSSIAIQSNNNPVIAYYDITNGTLKVAECTTATCSNATIKTIGPADDSGRMSIAIGNDGTPLVAYIDNNSLKVARVPVG